MYRSRGPWRSAAGPLTAPDRQHGLPAALCNLIDLSFFQDSEDLGPKGRGERLLERRNVALNTSLRYEEPLRIWCSPRSGHRYGHRWTASAHAELAVAPYELTFFLDGDRTSGQTLRRVLVPRLRLGRQEGMR